MLREHAPPFRRDLWVPLAMRGQLQGDPGDQLYNERGHRSVGLYGRLKRHGFPAQATAINVPAASIGACQSLVPAPPR